MPEAPPVPTTPAPEAVGELFANYDPQGAMGGLFAPAYIKGFAPSEQAVAQWQAQNRPVTSAMVDELRMPELWQPPSGRTLADGVYGSGVPSRQSYLDPRGMIDPNALRAAAMGGKYDVQARRDAIAARVAENARLQGGGGAPAPAKDEKYPDWMTDDEAFQRMLARQRQQSIPIGMINSFYPG